MALSTEECLNIMEEYSQEFSEKYTTHSFEDILNLYSVDFNTYIKALVACNCCERHKLNTSCDLVNSYQQQKTPFRYVDKNECTCPCRHYIRALCRAYYENQDSYKKSSSSTNVDCCFRSQCEFRCNCK